MKNMDGNNACDETDQASEQNEPPVVVPGKAGKDAEHVIDQRLSPDRHSYWIGCSISIIVLQFPARWLSGRQDQWRNNSNRRKRVVRLAAASGRTIIRRRLFGRIIATRSIAFRERAIIPQAAAHKFLS